MLLSEATTTAGIKRYTLTEQIVEWLSSRIITGEYPPNAPLTEVDLAETLGCSRSPLREALRVLAQEGLVELVPGKGATVSPFEPRRAGEFYDTGARREAAAARRAAPAMTPAQRERLWHILHELRETAEKGDVAAYQDINWSFHTELYSFCPNSTIVDLVRMIWRRTLRYGYLLRGDPWRLRASVERKTRLMTALEAGDADAVADQITKIILGGKGDVMEALTLGATDPYQYWIKKREALS